MKDKFATSGIIVGGLALMLALVHFWAGPFSPQPSIESVVSEKAASFRQAAIDAIKGKEQEPLVAKPSLDLDKITQIVIAVLGGLAFILAVLSFTNRESIRAAGGAAVLGVSAIAFQFIVMYVMALLVVFLIVSVLGSFGSEI